MVLWGLVMGCFSPAEGPVMVDPLDGPDPQIEAVRWSCDVEAGTWSFSIQTAAWTGGGEIWMAQNDDTVEVHRIRSVEAAADGSTDALALELESVADWRDAVSGRLTRWRCADEPVLTFQAVVFETTGQREVDCRSWGAEPLLWDTIEAAPGCETLLALFDTGGGGFR